MDPLKRLVLFDSKPTNPYLGEILNREYGVEDWSGKNHRVMGRRKLAPENDPAATPKFAFQFLSCLPDDSTR